MERKLNLFYQTFEEWLQIKSGQKTKTQEIMENTPNWPKNLVEGYPFEIGKRIQAAADEIGQSMVNAVCERNHAVIQELADAVKFLKGFKPDGDPLRSKLLLFKQMSSEGVFKQHQKQWTISEVAKLVQWPKSRSVDGFSALRRLCRELDFPLARSRQIRRK